MNYLTVQDILWLHFQITKESCTYNYVNLEAITYAQYGYGKSYDLFQQAWQFYNQIVLKAPFVKENNSLALLAVQCFFSINGFFCDKKEDLQKYLEKKNISKIKSICYESHKKSLQEYLKSY